MRVTVRRLHGEQDFDELCGLSRVFFAEYEAHHGEFFKLDRLADGDVRAYFASFLDRDDRAAFVAVQDGRIAAYITLYVQEQPSYWRVRRVGHISGLMVEPESRRLGIASQLLVEAQRFFAAQGIEYYTVYTAVANDGAIGFYRARGLEPLYVHLLGQVEPEQG